MFADLSRLGQGYKPWRPRGKLCIATKFANNSSELSIIAAAVPNAPQSVSTSIQSSKVRVSWVAPSFNGGSTILEYIIEIKEADNDYSTVTSECDGTNSITIANSYCEIEMNTLTASPFLIAKDSVIIARVSAKNTIGTGATLENSSGITASVTNVSLRCFGF